MPNKPKDENDPSGLIEFAKRLDKITDENKRKADDEAPQQPSLKPPPSEATTPPE